MSEPVATVLTCAMIVFHVSSSDLECYVFAEEFGADVAFGRGPHAVAGDAGADEFEVGVWPEYAGGGVGDGAEGGAEAVLRE